MSHTELLSGAYSGTGEADLNASVFTAGAMKALVLRTRASRAAAVKPS